MHVVRYIQPEPGDLRAVKRIRYRNRLDVIRDRIRARPGVVATDVRPALRVILLAEHRHFSV